MPEKYYEKSLRELRERKKIPAELKEEVKRQGKVRAAILKAVSSEAKTVLQIASEINEKPHTVLWFVAALRKYGQITENGKDGDYHKYAKKR